jgi:hypothetical protein
VAVYMTLLSAVTVVSTYLASETFRSELH